MSDWFTAKIKYLKQLDNGSIASRTDNYLLNALSFTEAEARLQGILEQSIPEYNLLVLAKTNIEDVVIDEADEFFFKTKVSYISADADSGKETKITEVYMIQAETVEGATDKMKSRLEGSIVDWEIPSVVKTTIVDCFPYVD